MTTTSSMLKPTETGIADFGIITLSCTDQPCFDTIILLQHEQPILLMSAAKSSFLSTMKYRKERMNAFEAGRDYCFDYSYFVSVDRFSTHLMDTTKGSLCTRQ